MKKGDKVTIIGFGTLSVEERKARKGRNPQTGKKSRLHKEGSQVLRGSALKAAISGKAVAAKPKAKKSTAKTGYQSKKK